MCGSNSSTVQSTSGPPQAFLDAYKDVYSQARGLTGQPFQQYTGPMVAGFSPDQLSAFGTIQNTQGLAQPYFNQAAAYYQTAAQPITPMGFSANGWDNYTQNLPQIGLDYLTYAGRRSEEAARPIDLMDYDISPYQNAYTTDVTNALSDLYARNNAEQFNQIRGNAAAQNAFGGDREAIAEAETAKQQKLAQDPTLAQVRQQGFAQAQEEFNKQQAADLQRQLAERQYAMAAGQLGLGIGQGMWGEFNTQQAQNTQAQDTSAWLQNYAGTNFANLGQLAQNAALSGANAQLGIGGMEQQLGQQMLNVPYYQFMQQQAYPYQQMGWLSNIATGLGGASGGNASTTYPGPSTLGQVAGLGTVGLGVYGLGKDQGWWGGSSLPSNSYYDAFNAQPFMGGGGDFVADGGAVPRRAPGGAVGLAVPPEFGGAMIPEGLDSYIPGAHGLGAEPASKEGSGLSKMFMQPVTAQTQQQSGGGGLGQILGLGLSAAKLFLAADGGAAPVPRGTRLAGYAEGGAPVHPAAPIVADLIHVAAPSSRGPVTQQSVMPAMNFAPTVDSQGYPGALVGVPNTWTPPPPLSIPMLNGRMDRAALNPVAAAPAPAPVMSGLDLSPVLDVPVAIEDRGSGDADGGRIGLGYDDGGPVGGAPVPLGPPDPAQQLAEKIRRIQELERLRVDDRFPRFSDLPLGGSARDAGGAVGLAGYIPAAPQFHAAGMGPPKPPTMPGWKPDDPNDSMMSLLKSAKGFLSALNHDAAGSSLGGAVGLSATPLQYDDGGSVGGMGMSQSPMQQRALLQQYQNLPIEKLRELAMRYPPTTPQGAALQRALQLRQMNPSYPGNTGPARPFGPSGQVQPGTVAADGGRMRSPPASGRDLVIRAMPFGDWVEPPPKDWTPPPPPPPRPVPKEEMPIYWPIGMAGGGDPVAAYADIPPLAYADLLPLEPQRFEYQAPFTPRPEPAAGLAAAPIEAADQPIVNVQDTPLTSPAQGLAQPVPTKSKPGYVDGQYYPNIDAWNIAMDKQAVDQGAGLTVPPPETGASALRDGLAAPVPTAAPVDRTNSIVPVGVPRGTLNPPQAVAPMTRSDVAVDYSRRDPRGVVPVIQAAAEKYGIDPGVMLRVAASEGLGTFLGDNGTSGGAMQLHVTPGGKGRAVGDLFREQTGLDPLDPKNEAATIDFAAKIASQQGWGAWHGAGRVGIGPWEGIKGAEKVAGAPDQVIGQGGASSLPTMLSSTLGS